MNNLQRLVLLVNSGIFIPLFSNVVGFFTLNHCNHWNRSDEDSPINTDIKLCEQWAALWSSSLDLLPKKKVKKSKLCTNAAQDAVSIALQNLESLTFVFLVCFTAFMKSCQYRFLEKAHGLLKQPELLAKHSL